jgi:putative sterol carrier protein
VNVTQDIKEFFDTLPGRAEGRTAGVNSTYVFDIEGAGAWTVAVTDEGVQVTEGDQGGDCTIQASSETFSRIVSQEQNATTAYMTGKLKIKGDMGAAMKLQKLF